VNTINAEIAKIAEKTYLPQRHGVTETHSDSTASNRPLNSAISAISAFVVVSVFS